MTKIVKSNLRQTIIASYKFEPPSDIRRQEWSLTVRLEVKYVTFIREGKTRYPREFVCVGLVLPENSESLAVERNSSTCVGFSVLL
jgi:hypothetical protein